MADVCAVRDDDRPWSVWIYDLFDQESEGSEESRGVGTIAGFRELWRLFLSVGVVDSGQSAMRDFTLFFESPRARVGLHHLTQHRRGVVALRRWRSDPAKLLLLAQAHAATVGDEPNPAASDALFRLAAETEDEAALIQRLQEIAAPGPASRGKGEGGS